MTRKWILLSAVLLLAPLLMGVGKLEGRRYQATGVAGGPFELVLVNKSGMPIEMTLTGQDTDSFYVLRMDAGTRDAPLEQTFEVLPDTYSSSVFYVEIYDPVYGYTCTGKSMTLPVYRKVRLTVTECDNQPRGRPEAPAILKYGVPIGRRSR
jgi:hypothetical protein